MFYPLYFLCPYKATKDTLILCSKLTFPFDCSPKPNSKSPEQRARTKFLIRFSKRIRRRNEKTILEERLRPKLPRETEIEQDNFKDLVRRKQENYKTGIENENFKVKKTKHKTSRENNWARELQGHDAMKTKQKTRRISKHRVKNNERTDDRISYPVPITLISKEKNRERKHIKLLQDNQKNTGVE